MALLVFMLDIWLHAQDHVTWRTSSAHMEGIQRAYSLNGRDVDGSRIVVEFAKWISWSDEELKMIEISSLYYETMKHKAQIDKDFFSETMKHEAQIDKDFFSVLDQFPGYFEDVMLHEFKYEYNLVESRAWVSTRGVSMIPFADFFNHDSFLETDVLSDDFTQVSEVIADENYAPGDEVFIRYRKFSNARLLLDFGFALAYNKYNQVQVEVNVHHHDQLREMKLRLLDQHVTPALKDVNDLCSQRMSSLEVKSSSCKGWGIPQSLRALARVLCCTSPQELQDLATSAARNDGRLARIPLKNKEREVEAHQFLVSRFSKMIGSYNVALEIPLLILQSLPLSGKHKRRMQLAQDLLNGELQILESASSWLKNYCETLKDL
ncbi:uncharacterized protein [Rutidosis leptorrhynchoides]|uniref:uncharacterized protein n=1 Tax=Rutidosis leptorrhynchoides TaxID=125765 RepID=UPI003A99119A